MRLAVAALLLGLAACATTPPRQTPGLQARPDQHLPGYVRRPPVPFSRAEAIAIAQREWRAFGSTTNDDPPTVRIPYELRPDQQPGLWQRVGDYWWSSQDAGMSEGEWNSRFNEAGTPYAGDPPAWSAAFISYVMRMAGAGTGFPYTPLHADYINAAARSEGVLRAERPDTYAPQPGDLICLGRLSARNLKFDDLPSSASSGIATWW